MAIQFVRLGADHGVPVYFQHLPVVGSVAIRWLTFTGSADDCTVGRRGLYHWFEHVPFRGTKLFPGGYEDTIGYFSRWSGKVNACTKTGCTSYFANVPREKWHEGGDLVTDLLACPLLSDEAIAAERIIIHQEIGGALSNVLTSAYYHLDTLLYGNHPLAHSPLGNDDDLDAMTADVLIPAHEKGYGRARCVLIVTGDLNISEVTDAANKWIEVLPARNLSERRCPVDYGVLPDLSFGERTIIDTNFNDSVVVALWQVPRSAFSGSERWKWEMLDELFYGVSPLLRIMREERNLAYGVRSIVDVSQSGGQFGFVAQTGRKANIESIIAACSDVLSDQQVRSREWLQLNQDRVRCRPLMRPVSTNSYAGSVEDRLCSFGRVVNDNEMVEQLTTVSHQEILSLFNYLDFDKARIVVYRGTG